MRVLVALVLLILAPPASAAWDVGQFKDAMTDRTETFAKLAPNDGGGTLYVGCMNGKIFPQIRFQERISYRKTIGAAFRFDSGAIEQRNAALSADGRDVWLWMGFPDPSAATVARMQHSKRLRVQVASSVLDFDLTGADVALSKVRCR
jgi:hypothetical protein